jgi:neutral ceramidase
MRYLFLAATFSILGLLASSPSPAAEKVFRAGAFAIDITPLELPVLVNGNMNAVLADKVNDRLHARCLVLDDGANQVAIVIVDSCMIPRSLLDEAKELASKATGIPTNHMLISATHAHSAPSSYGCLGTDADPKYIKFLPPQIAKGITYAQKNLVPARIGWGMGRDEKNVANRHWVMKPGIAPTNRFGGTKDDTVMMHPGHNNPNAIRPAGPVDRDVPVVSLQTLDGEPLALLSAYSLHYVGAPALSADYFAAFCEIIDQKIRGVSTLTAKQRPPFMAALANATSGDTWLMDYTQKERRKYSLEGVAQDVSSAAFEAYKKITYFDWAPLVMEERLLTVGVRMPSDDEVAAAKEMVKTIETGKPMNLEQIYARETLLLNDMSPTRELKLQAIRIGDLAIGTIPNEVYGSTGLNIKKDSPIKTTFVIELANGCEGYLPPPELLKLGGYTCWRARTSCLESEAEPKIRAAVLELLGKVAKTRADEPAVPAKKP